MCQLDLAYIYVNFWGHLSTSELKVKKKYINLIKKYSFFVISVKIRCVLKVVP